MQGSITSTMGRPALDMTSLPCFSTSLPSGPTGFGRRLHLGAKHFYQNKRSVRQRTLGSGCVPDQTSTFRAPCPLVPLSNPAAMSLVEMVPGRCSPGPVGPYLYSSFLVFFFGWFTVESEMVVAWDKNPIRIRMSWQQKAWHPSFVSTASTGFSTMLL
ncbi:hypothetical protein BGZ61DRAFT_112277 [Ilyonectria robusta]|uniref:uncharacterized protein n=1 Tax=Ilyonectria robusta TaxID=1079257 RepID=UPI001E8EA877|nr:uncharacterized protein BGZ61DRAFT_112277 [Ilyonectria robusta]KAH8669903.1 hypothetical protein BGZ61DRAFT_112277 [Ilyonectria robusta]